MSLLGMIMYYSFSGKAKIAVRKLPSKVHFFLPAFAKLEDDWNLEEREILTREENTFFIFDSIRNLLILFKQIYL